MVCGPFLRVKASRCTSGVQLRGGRYGDVVGDEERLAVVVVDEREGKDREAQSGAELHLM